MAEKYKFFNSTASDRRRHTAGDMAEYWSSFLSTGLISRDKVPLLRVTANGVDNVLNIGVGSAIIKGHLYINDSDLEKTVPLPSGLDNRIDRVVLRLDNRRGVDDSRYIKIFIKEGTEDAPPELEREVVEGTTVLYELSLAQVKLNAGQSYITQDDITDERLDEGLCGMASSLVSIPTEIFGEQWRDFVDEYYSWFEGIKNEMYATEKEVRQRDHALKREISYLEMMMEADRRIKNGIIFADNFKGNPHNIEYLKGKAELVEDVEPNGRELKFTNPHDFHEGIKEITIYDQEKQERLEVGSIEGDTVYLSKPIVNGFEAQAMLFESVHQIEDGYMKVGEVPSGMTVEINNIDLGDIYDEWYIYDDIFYLRKGKEVYYYDLTRKTTTLIFTQKRKLESADVDVYYRLIPLLDGVAIASHVDGGTFEFVMFVDGIMKDRLEFSFGRDYDSALNKGVSRPSRNLNRFIVIEYREGSFHYFHLVNWNGSNLLMEKILYSGTGGSLSGSSPVVMLNNDEFIYKRGGSAGSIRVANISEKNENVKVISNSENMDNVILSNRNTESFIANYTYGTRKGWRLVKDNGVEEISDNVSFESDYVVYDDGFAVYIVMNSGYIEWIGNEATYKTDGKVTKENIITPYLEGEPKEKPFQLIDGRYADGRFFEGVLFEPKEADIRFKVPKTKEVVSYIENNGLGEYSGWFNQHSTADKSMGNEIQMIGTSSDEYDTFRLTVKRDSIDEDNRITRILGGVL